MTQPADVGVLEHARNSLLTTAAFLLRLAGFLCRAATLLVLEVLVWLGVAVGLFYRQRRSLDSKVVLITGKLITSFAAFCVLSVSCRQLLTLLMLGPSSLLSNTV